MDPNNDRNRKIMLGAGLAIVIFGALIFLLALPGDEEPVTIGSDSTSQTTSPETSQAQSDVEYQGFNELSQQGFTGTQMAGVRYALFQYAPKAKSFKIATASIVQSPYDRDNPTDYIGFSFAIAIDGKNYAAKVEKYQDLNTIRIVLSANSKQVFDSKPIDVSKLPSQSDGTAGD